MSKQRIVQAIAAMTAHGLVGTDMERARRIQAAMVAAIELAQAEGITDPAVIRERQLAARDKVMSASE